jgi:hypothetical protein
MFTYDIPIASTNVVISSITFYFLIESCLHHVGYMYRADKSGSQNDFMVDHHPSCWVQFVRF